MEYYSNHNTVIPYHLILQVHINNIADVSVTVLGHPNRIDIDSLSSYPEAIKLKNEILAKIKGSLIDQSY